MTEKRTPAYCRGCRRPLDGDDYCYGGRAYVPHGPNADLNRPRVEAKANHYGGFVCSYGCDRRAALELERSMPGHGYSQRRLSVQLEYTIAARWGIA